MLAEHTSVSGNFPTITRVLLAKIGDSDGKMSYVYDQHCFHYIVDNGLIFLCMCDDLNKRRVPFSFLEDIKEKFTTAYGQRAQTAIAFTMNDSFGPVLKEQMDYFESNNGDNFSAIHEKLDDVKNVMVQNIDLVLERGEKVRASCASCNSKEIRGAPFIFALKLTIPFPSLHDRTLMLISWSSWWTRRRLFKMKPLTSNLGRRNLPKPCGGGK